MKRSPLRRGKPLARGSGLRRKSRVKPRNDTRREKDFAANFGSRARVLWVNSHPCSCAGKHPACSGRTVNAHVASRGAGGTWRDIIPLSYFCHLWQGDHGWADWLDAAGLGPGRAAELAREFAARGPA